MANQKISQLSNAAALTGTEQVPIVQSGVTVKATTQNIGNLALPSQTGQSGKYLQTNGTTASWQTVTTLPTFGVFKVNVSGGNISITTIIPYSAAVGIQIAFPQSVIRLNSSGFTSNTVVSANPGLNFTTNGTLIARQRQTSPPLGFIDMEVFDLNNATVDLSTNNTGSMGIVFYIYN